MFLQYIMKFDKEMLQGTEASEGWLKPQLIEKVNNLRKQIVELSEGFAADNLIKTYFS